MKEAASTRKLLESSESVAKLEKVNHHMNGMSLMTHIEFPKLPSFKVVELRIATRIAIAHIGIIFLHSGPSYIARVVVPMSCCTSY